jgi:hypothetical protein
MQLQNREYFAGYTNTFAGYQRLGALGLERHIVCRKLSWDGREIRGGADPVLIAPEVSKL